MNLKKQVLAVVFLFNTSHICFGQNGLDKHEKKALNQTQQLLKDSKARQNYINTSEKAKKVDQNVDQLVNTKKQKQEIYEISSDIFGDVVNKNGGDVNKLNDFIKKASQDPEAFYRGLSSEQKAKIKSLADELKPTENPNQ